MVGNILLFFWKQYSTTDSIAIISRSYVKQKEFKGLEFNSPSFVPVLMNILEDNSHVFISNLIVKKKGLQVFEHSSNSQKLQFTDVWINRFKINYNHENLKLSLDLTHSIYWLAFFNFILIALILLAHIIFKLIVERINSAQEHEIILKKEEVASQVAHDIRSPLAALSMITGDLDGIKEEKRLIIRGAVTRINDIANGLLVKNKELAKKSSKKEVSKEKSEKVLLSTLVDGIISEKRTQFRGKPRIKIDSTFDKSSYGLFSLVQPTEFKRVCSNLLNNAVEILDQSGDVTISLKRSGDEIELRVEDNGKGIPAHILSKLGLKGESHGKKEGSGLGLYHAKASVESWDGQLKIESEVGVGTSVIITLPISGPPQWFVPSVELTNNVEICVLDDDQSIHHIWDSRFSSADFEANDIKVHHFTSANEIISWYKHQGNVENMWFFVDYELLGHSINGFDVIKEMGVTQSSSLVTSRYEDKKIIETVESLGMGLIPKSMVSYIPINITPKVSKDKVTVLLDDDPLVHMIWEYGAKENCGVDFRPFFKPEKLMNQLDTYDTSSTFYIDSCLDNDVKGEDIAKEIFNRGFENIYLATGYDPDHFGKLEFVKGVVGKNHPWSIA